MNHIARLQAEIASQAAEIEALRAGYQSMIDYMHSSKFATEPYVNVADVVLGLRQSASNATDVANNAWMNEVGPKPIATNTGWACPDCRTSLRSDEYNGNTEAKAEERMRLHWIALHQVKA